MTFREVTGDLLSSGFDTIGHGVNLRGVMGAGIAKTIANRWPTVVAPYRAACRSGRLSLGGYQGHEAPDGPIIYNLATQRHTGPNAELWAVRASVAAALDDVERRGRGGLAIPRIGCGIGGLKWSEVREVLRDVSESCGPDLIVVTLGA